MDIKTTLRKLTTEDKAKLINGFSSWYTYPFPKYEIPSIRVSDGPYGLRVVSSTETNINDSIKATCFPPLCTLASTWDDSLAYEMGLALGEECQENKVNVILGPAINIKRHPLCGRNFEYLSEDPDLVGHIGTAYVNGVQSQGVGVSLKHFACNNEENGRFYTDSLVDERALREIYLKGFETVVRNAQPDTVMCSYNRYEGRPVSESKKLLTTILRDEWGFQGVVMSDWGAVANRVKSLDAGLDLEMPGDNKHSEIIIKKSIESNFIGANTIDVSCERILRIIDKLKSKEIPNFKYDREAHHTLATRIAASGAVLMKNEDNALPLKRGENVSLIGAFASEMRYEGGGSSHVNANRVIEPLEALKVYGIFPYESGYSLTNDVIDEKEETKALAVAKRTDKIIYFMGLSNTAESEGLDRKNMDLPANQLHLLDRLLELNIPVVVVLMVGSPVELPFNDKVKAILNMYLPGEGGGTALAQLLFGDVNPSGKLAETWPVKLTDVPSDNYFNKRDDVVEYRESIYVGYRYYQKVGIKPLYAFGHGLSYTDFVYSDLSVDVKDTIVSVNFKVKNAGTRAGAEVVQLYVGHEDTAVFKAPNELKRFSKIYLEPGEEKIVAFNMTNIDFSYYNASEHAWVAESGYYKINVGSASDDIRASQEFLLKTGNSINSPYDPTLLPNYFSPICNVFPDREFEAIIGKEIPKPKNKLPLTLDSPLRDFSLTHKGRFILKTANKVLRLRYRKAQKIKNSEERQKALESLKFTADSLPNMTLNVLASIAASQLPRNVVLGLLKYANHHVFAGLFMMIFKRSEK